MKIGKDKLTDAQAQFSENWTGRGSRIKDQGGKECGRGSTPGQAIRRICVACVGSPYAVRDCGGDQCLGGQGNEDGICYFYPYRLGRGRPSVKLIRKFCRECLGGSSQAIAECEKKECPLHQFRFGKHPKRAGRMPKHLRKYCFTAQKSPRIAFREKVNEPCTAIDETRQSSKFDCGLEKATGPV